MKYAVDVPETEKFLQDLINVFHKHKMALSHEDEGSFLVVDINMVDVAHLLNAYDNRKEVAQ